MDSDVTYDVDTTTGEERGGLGRKVVAAAVVGGLVVAAGAGVIAVAGSGSSVDPVVLEDGLVYQPRIADKEDLHPEVTARVRPGDTVVEVYVEAHYGSRPPRVDILGCDGAGAWWPVDREDEVSYDMFICPGAEPGDVLTIEPSFSDVEPFRMPLAG